MDGDTAVNRRRREETPKIEAWMTSRDIARDIRIGKNFFNRSNWMIIEPINFAIIGIIVEHVDLSFFFFNLGC